MSSMGRTKVTRTRTYTKNGQTVTETEEYYTDEGAEEFRDSFGANAHQSHRQVTTSDARDDKGGKHSKKTVVTQPAEPAASKGASGGSGSSSDALKAFRQDALRAHNEYRRQHQVPPLQLNDELNHTAQAWADRLTSSGAFEHSDNKYQGQPLGENISSYYNSGIPDYTGQMMTDQWYSEVSKHDYTKDHQSGSGHFSQVVWKDSTSVGFGRARDASGKWKAVANYAPAGNFIGTFQKNVFPPK